MIYKAKDIKLSGILFATVFSVIITLISYNFLYKICKYKNLQDFYSGITIYNNHNKYLDIGIYFLYLLLFFIILFFESFLIYKFKKQKNKNNTADICEHFTCFISKFKNNQIIKKIRNFLIKYQYIGAAGFVFLHPFNGHFYPKIAAVIMFLFLISLIDVNRKTKDKESKSFSPFIISSVLFILFFSPYNLTFAPVDNHHFGEKFAVFFMHNNFNLDYYKDIMLVHGITDIIPSWLGANLFKENNVYGYCLGEVLYRNLSLIILYISGLFIFKKNPLFFIPVLLIKIPTPACIFVCSYLLMLKKTFLNRPCVSLCILIALVFIFVSMWTTIGSFWALGCIPLLFFLCYKISKYENKKDFIKILLPLSILVIIITVFHSVIFEYLKSSIDYIKGNLYSFGNDFVPDYISIYNIFHYIYKMFVLLFLPVLILELVKESINMEKNIKQILFLSFSVIFAITAIGYMLGRTDGMLMQRLEYLSVPYLFIILPFFLYKFNMNNSKTIIILYILLTYTLINQFIQIPNKLYSLEQTNLNHSSELFNCGNISFHSEYEKNITDIKNFVYKKGENKTFLDLTNSGMLYLYLNKKIPVKYISYYNCISTKQSVREAEKLKENMPDIILIKTSSYPLDRVFPSLRVNPLYRLIILSKKYKLEEYKNNVFLVKSEKEINYNTEELMLLDGILSKSNLEYLPEVWAASLNTLPVKKLSKNFYSYVSDNKIIINFYNNEKVQDIDLLYVNVNNPASFKINIDSNPNEIYCKSQAGKILVPLDNFPSTLLNNNLKVLKIEVQGKKPENYKIDFYKRYLP